MADRLSAIFIYRISTILAFYRKVTSYSSNGYPTALHFLYICGTAFAVNRFMKHFYLVALLFVCALGFSQENAQGSADIEGFKLYPNPVTQGKVYIETKLNSPKKILVFDVLGTQVIETTLLGKELNLSNLDKGVYILRVFENNKVATRKLIVK